MTSKKEFELETAWMQVSEAHVYCHFENDVNLRYLDQNLASRYNSVE